MKALLFSKRRELLVQLRSVTSCKTIFGSTTLRNSDRTSEQKFITTIFYSCRKITTFLAGEKKLFCLLYKILFRLITFQVRKGVNFVVCVFFFFMFKWWRFCSFYSSSEMFYSCVFKICEIEFLEDAFTVVFLRIIFNIGDADVSLNYTRKWAMMLLWCGCFRHRSDDVYDAVWLTILWLEEKF